MGIDIQEIYETVTPRALAERYILHDGFVFTAVTRPENVYDGIVIKHPHDAPCCSPIIKGSLRSLDEHIDLINRYQLKKALIIAENLDFITRCPSLEHLWIVPADSAEQQFDYSPLYKLPRIRSLSCKTVYGKREELTTSIDCGKLQGLESIHVTNSNYKNFRTIPTLKDLGLANYKSADLSEGFESSNLDTLMIITSKIQTLNGIEKSDRLQCLYLYHNRSLRDINALLNVKSTLKALRIENCPKIEDFSLLGHLENLESLSLWGSNELPNLSFLKTMKNLKTFTFSMNVKDGDLSPCMNLSWAATDKNRKHYNIKNDDLPKVAYVRGNEAIEEWRRWHY